MVAAVDVPSFRLSIAIAFASGQSLDDKERERWTQAGWRGGSTRTIRST